MLLLPQPSRGSAVPSVESNLIHGGAQRAFRFLALGVCFLLHVGCSGDAPQLTLNNGLKISDRAPEIVGVYLDGNPMNLSDFRGKVVLLDFFGDW
jgi:hypothetical protein